jgi:energy-converting hydrogenase Eha subunit B
MSSHNIREGVRLDQCYRCGGYVAAALARLGSTLCHDCRDAGSLPR